MTMLVSCKNTVSIQVLREGQEVWGASRDLLSVTETEADTIAAADVNEMTDTMKARSNMLKGCILKSKYKKNGQQ